MDKDCETECVLQVGIEDLQVKIQDLRSVVKHFARLLWWVEQDVEAFARRLNREEAKHEGS